MLRFYMTVQVTKKGEPVWAPRGGCRWRFGWCLTLLRFPQAEQKNAPNSFKKCQEPKFVTLGGVDPFFLYACFFFPFCNVL